MSAHPSQPSTPRDRDVAYQRGVDFALQRDVSFAQLLWEAADCFGDRPAMVERGAPDVSFEQLRQRAAAIAAALIASGVEPGDRVAISLKRGADAAAAFFGALAAGAVATNLNEMYRPRQVEFVLEHARARVLLTSADVLASHPRALETRARVLDVATIAARGHFAPRASRAGDVAQICYTSGSTGRPKGVLVSHGNLWAGVRVVVGYLGITADDRVASLLPFSFVYGFNQLTCVLLSGATLVIERSALAVDIVAALRAESVTVLAAVPPLWLQLLKAPGFDHTALARLRVATNAGGRLAPEAVLRLRAALPGAHLFSMYGLTEVFRSTYLPPELVDLHPDSMGRAVPGSQVFVVRDDGTECDVGEIGELVHRGPTVALGYLDDAEATGRVFRPNVLGAGARAGERVVFSGDLVRRDAEGLLYYVGRRDRMIKTLGYRVSPDEIADVMYQSGEIEEGVIVAEPCEQRGERIVAHVVLRGEGSVQRLKVHCGAELPRYMQPVRFELHDALPRNGNGKHDILALVNGTTTAAALTR